MDALLKVSHLEKDFDTFQLKNINLTLNPGYIMGLLGVNGTGKTTLISTILNLYTRTRGEVLVDGFSMETQEKEAKDRIGFILDRNMFSDSMTVIGNANAFGKLYSRYDEELFRIFCRHFGVPLKKKLGKLSTGTKIRFQLAFALSHDAKLFIFDEPAAGLDPVFRKELIGYMREIVEDGTRSILMSTHITEDLESVGDYITLMKDGELLYTLTMEELRDRYLIVYGTEKDIRSLPFKYVIYTESGTAHHYAFIKKTTGEAYGQFRTKVPTLEEIMYALEKGEYAYV